MKSVLVGCTGFVGGNLAAEYPFDGMFHSSDIEKAFGTHPQLLVYAGLPAAKYLANVDPDGDFAVMENAMENIRRIAPEKLVLISTVDVYVNPRGVDETVPADFENPAAYGRNRAKMEQMVRAEYPDALIVRLPALYGRGLKKNFLYDLMTIVPAMLKENKFRELCGKNPQIADCYVQAQNGFYALQPLGTQQKKQLKEWFAQNDFNALSFTDSRAEYQFYNLANLWRDISLALRENITLLNITAEPVSAAEIYRHLTGKTFCNEVAQSPAHYDMRSIHAQKFGGENGYCYPKTAVLESIAAFAQMYKKENHA